MEPKEKANEILNKMFASVDKECEGEFVGRIEAAKACARICVEEIIYLVDRNRLKSNDVKVVYEYWQSVLSHLS